MRLMRVACASAEARTRRNRESFDHIYQVPIDYKVENAEHNRHGDQSISLLVSLSSNGRSPTSFSQ